MARNKKGFTLVELMVVIAILGTLATSALPVYRTWQQRAYGSEATYMLDQIIKAEIAFYLEHDYFYPKNNSVQILNDGTMIPSGAVGEVDKELNILIPQGHFIDYIITGTDTYSSISISSAGSFNLFKNASIVSADIDKDGQIKINYN